MIINFLICPALFVGILVFYFAGYRVRSFVRSQESSESAGIINNSVLALLGLLIAFSFSNAYTRLDARRQLITSEVNAIGTAYLRMELLDAASHNQMGGLFQNYVNARVLYYENVHEDNLKSAMDSLQKTQTEIWALALSATKGPTGETPRRLLLPALNEMFDIATARAIAMQTHIPAVILVMLFVLTLVCSFLIGCHATSKNHALYALIFAFVITFVLFVIIDIEHPRSGLVRLDSANQHLKNLLTTLTIDGNNATK